MCAPKPAYTKKVIIDSVEADAKEVAAELDWMKLEQRWLFSWDATKAGQRNVPVHEAPCMADIVDRIKMVAPPSFKMPELPAQIPESTGASTFKLVYPWEPSCRLGMGVLAMNKLPLDSVDIVCSNSFIYALSGVDRYAAYTYFMQWQGTTLSIISEPLDKNRSYDEPGHRVKGFLCKERTGDGVNTFVCSKRQIGDFRVLLTSEVDAREENNEKDLIQIKTSRFLHQQIPVQLVCNTASGLLHAKLNREKTIIEEAEVIKTADLIE